MVFADTELKCSKCYDRKAKIALRTSKCCNRQGKKQRATSKCYCRLGKTAKPPYLRRLGFSRHFPGSWCFGSCCYHPPESFCSLQQISPGVFTIGSCNCRLSDNSLSLCSGTYPFLAFVVVCSCSFQFV